MTDNKKIEEQNPKAVELTEKDLGGVAGGSTYNTTKSNVRTSKLDDVAHTPPVPGV